VKLEQRRKERRPRQGLQLIGDDLMQYLSRSHGAHSVSGVRGVAPGDEHELVNRSGGQEHGGRCLHTDGDGGVYNAEQLLENRSREQQSSAVRRHRSMSGGHGVLQTLGHGEHDDFGVGHGAALYFQHGDFVGVSQTADFHFFACQPVTPKRRKYNSSHSLHRIKVTTTTQQFPNHSPAVPVRLIW